MSIDKTDSTERTALSGAIDGVESLIKQEKASARWVALSIAATFACLILAAIYLHQLETYMASDVLSKFKSAMEAYARSPAGGDRGAGMSQAESVTMQLKPQIDAIAEHAHSAGVQYYNALLLSGAAVFALVFGLLMAVYRQHLTEISKLQNTRLAFMRVRVATESAKLDDRSLLIQEALLYRAFEYRSGKEKQIEGPLPGHPVSDASVMIVDRLVEALKRGRDEA